MFDPALLQTIKQCLESGGQTIAVAESVTSGLLQAALSTAEEATKFFQGGLTAYNIGQKCRHLDVNPIHAQSCNCVSERMARDMACSVATRFTADWGIGVTGYATPVPESDGAVFAFASIARDGQVVRTVRLEAGDRRAFDAQQHYVHRILEALVDVLKHPGQPMGCT